MLFLFITKLFLALIALLVLALGMFLVLRLFDWLLGISFKESFKVISTCPRALSNYYGQRMLGFCVAIGVIVCFVVVL